LEAFAKELARRQGEIERSAEQLQAERDEEIRLAHGAGLPEQAIAKILKISQQRVNQILRR
jgi:DNA-directed RNA polymerase specialized sigma24 family protein